MGGSDPHTCHVQVHLINRRVHSVPLLALLFRIPPRETVHLSLDTNSETTVGVEATEIPASAEKVMYRVDRKKDYQGNLKYTDTLLIKHRI